jgi:phosphohistidine phosphatase
MKKLYLIRHAKSSWKERNLRDFDRPLNKRGNRDAPYMGNLLRQKGVSPSLIISSPAKRAITTANKIANEIGYNYESIIKNENIYEASAGEIIDIINSIEDEHETAMLFGHNPGFTMVANYLSNQRIDNIPTCGIAYIEFPFDSWSSVEVGTGKLIEFEYPKKYLRDE